MVVKLTVLGGRPEQDTGYQEDAIDDFRWREAIRLTMHDLDSQLVTALGEWEEKYLETEDYRFQVGNLKEVLEQEESRAYLEIDDNLLGGGTKVERETERKALIGVDDQVKESRASLRHAQGLLFQSEAELSVLAERLKYLGSRLSWRGRYLSLLASLPRSPESPEKKE